MSGQSIGSIIGGIIGVVLTPFTGGYSLLVTSALMAAGGMVGGLLDPPKGPHTVGPRLSDLQQQTSTYGAFIPRIYGTVALFGNVFWLENNKLKEVATTTTAGGKGGAPESSQTTYKYYATFAVGLCEGPIFGIKRIWISGKLWYHKGVIHESTLNVSADREKKFKLMLGTDTQMPLGRMEADVGVNNCPAMRGLAYLMIYDLDVGPYGNSLAGVQVKVEVIKTGDYQAVMLNKFRGGDGYYNSKGILVNEKTLYVARYWEIQIWDINVKTKPKLLGLTTGGVEWTGYGFALKDGYIYAPAQGIGWHKIFIYYVKEPSAAAMVAQISIAGDCRNLCIVDDLIYVPCANADVFQIFRIIAPTTVSLVGSVAIPTNPFGVVVVGGYAYIICASSESLVTVNISDPANPVVTSQINGAGGNLSYIVTDDSYLYLSSQAGPGVTIYSLLTPSSPTLTSTISGIFARGIVIDGNFIYVGTDDGVTSDIKVYNVTNRSAPVFIGSLAISGGNINHWQLAKQGNYLFTNDIIQPDSKFAIIFAAPRAISTNPTLASIINEECLKSNLLAAPDIDSTQLTSPVRGYRVGSLGAIRSAIEPLQGAWPFDVIQDGYKIKFVARGGAGVASISSDKLDARGAGQTPGIQITNIREMDSILPAKVSIKHLDFTREYDTGEQYYERINTDAINTTDIELPIVLTAAEAAGKAQSLCYLYWLERYDVAFTLPPEYNYLQPADVLTLTAPGQNYNLRIKQINYTQDGRLEIQAKYNAPALYTPTEVGEEGNQPIDILEEPGDTIYQLLDIPLVDDALDMPGFPVAMTGNLEGWPGGILSRSDDGGATYNSIQGFTAPGTTMGEATNTIGVNAGVLLDKSSILNVVLYSGTLASITELQMLNGANHFAYGADGRWEIIGVQNCILQADGSYNLSDMLRGRFGTEQYTGSHAIDDKVVLLASATMAFVQASSGMIGLPRDYKGVTSGQTLDEVTAQSFIYKGVNLECLSPVYPRASINPTNGDITIAWTRRGRVNNQWKDLIDVPVGESVEAYEVEIYSDNTFGTLKRNLTASSPTVAYSAADQVLDFGSGGDTLYPFVKLLLHGNGTNGITIFTDNSPSPKTLTPTGNVQISTAQSKFGGASIVFDGAGDYLSFTQSNIIGTGNFCVEAWIYPTSFVDDGEIFCVGDVGSTAQLDFFLEYKTTGALRGSVLNGAGVAYIDITTATGLIALNTWTHVAFTVAGTTGRLFINGVLSQTGTLTGTRVQNKTNCRVGFLATPLPRYYSGHIDDLRVTSGAGSERYTSNFTPHNAPHPDSIGLGNINFKVFQISPTVGRGYPAQATITL